MAESANRVYMFDSLDECFDFLPRPNRRTRAPTDLPGVEQNRGKSPRSDQMAWVKVSFCLHFWPTVATSQPRCRPRPGMKLSAPYRFFAVLRQSVSAKAGYSVEPLRRLSKRTALPFLRHLDIYLDIRGSIGTNGRTRAIGTSTECGLKKPRAFSAIRTDAYFMIPSIPSARIGSFYLV
jgi:hypothetical protein